MAVVAMGCCCCGCGCCHLIVDGVVCDASFFDNPVFSVSKHTKPLAFTHVRLYFASGWVSELRIDLSMQNLLMTITITTMTVTSDDDNNENTKN